MAFISGSRILVVDDDVSLAKNFRFCLEDAGYSVQTAHSVGQALERLVDAVFDLCLLDLNIGDESGLELLPRLRAEAPWMRVVMVTAETGVGFAVNAMQSGACDYLIKPCGAEQLVQVVGRQVRARQLDLHIESLQAAAEGETQAVAPIRQSRSPAMQKVWELARSVADTDAAVLVLGESGTGKNVLARAIHDWSPRSAANFATINCPSLNPELLESELFGHVKGAFTGATENRLGRVQVANGGTLFLDEIGDFPVGLQPKLLRFLQDREFERLGDAKTQKADVRVIAATNASLDAMVADGRFRADLFYRLNVITLVVPPLRERMDEVEPLATQYLLGFAARYRRPARRFSADALQVLGDYHWPGNLRELRNVMERVAILCPEEHVERHHLPAPLGGGATSRTRRLSAGDACSLEALERAHIAAVLARLPSLDAAAELLGINASTLYRKRRQFNL